MFGCHDGDAVARAGDPPTREHRRARRQAEQADVVGVGDVGADELGRGTHLGAARGEELVERGARGVVAADLRAEGTRQPDGDEREGHAVGEGEAPHPQHLGSRLEVE